MGSISFEQRDNWQICKRRSLFGSNTRTALGVRTGDELFIYGSQQGWLARCRVTADAYRPRGVEDVPWPDPERYVALMPIEVLDEPARPVAMSGPEIEQAIGAGTIQLPRFPRVDAQRAGNLTVLLSQDYRAHRSGAPADTPTSALVHPLLQALDELKVDRQLGRPAPYQQLVLLWAIAQAVQGEERLRPFSVVRDELRALLAPFAVGESAPDPELPWFALRKSPWWQLSPEPDGPVSRGGRDFVRCEDPVAGLVRELHRLVREDAAFRQAAIDKLSTPLTGHPSLHSALTSLFTAPAADERVEDDEAVAVLRGLVGRRLTTVTGHVNQVLRVEPPVVTVATERSLRGQPVPVWDVQRALDLLRRDGAVTIDVPTLGHRSSFIGAVLATCEDVRISGSPPVAAVHLDQGRPPAEEQDDHLVEGPAAIGAQGYEVGRIYDRGSIHDAAKSAGLPSGNRQTGISMVGRDLCIFWNPHKGLYANRWLAEPREFTYSGEGSVGDQREEGGNLWLLEREGSGQPVRLFVKTRSQGSAWMYMGAYLVAEHSWGSSQGVDGKWRRDLRFRFELPSAQVSHRPPRIPTPPSIAPPAPPRERNSGTPSSAAPRRPESGGEAPRRTSTSDCPTRSRRSTSFSEPSTSVARASCVTTSPAGLGTTVGRISKHTTSTRTSTWSTASQRSAARVTTGCTIRRTAMRSSQRSSTRCKDGSGTGDDRQ
ncbi:hypothetical protein [Geodermatophilus sp. URMC 62]|uniref:hypothetical protein n=1 Tax=Geodermatophilus sp. URMC 62 TaxID=3423414 RepID=UPI00406C47CF